ncbi:MAG: hypothetical protein ACRETL_11525, partial [Gammaproteobacteria bacterium]
MTTHHSKTSTLDEPVQKTQEIANHVLTSAQQVYGATRQFADDSLEQAQRVTRRGLEAATDAGSQAKRALTRYADSTGDYVANQPMKSVLIAAAAGAAIATFTLLLSGRRR